MEKRFFELFYKNSPTAYSCQRAIYDENGVPIDYVILDYNKAYADIMGIHDNELINKRYYSIFPKDFENIDTWKQQISDIVLNKKEIQLEIKRNYIKKWLRVSLFPIEGDIFGCIYFDVTQDFKQDKDIEGFLKVNIDMLVVADIEGYFQHVNQAFERVLGYKTEELEGKKFDCLVHQDDLLRSNDVLKDLKGQKNIANFINRIRCKDGSYRYIEWRCQANGNYIYASARDITESRNLEKELWKKNKHLAQLTEELKEKNKVLKTLAITDELTGLYNRHYLIHKIEEEIKLADSLNKSLSMIILDMDFFKHVNDTWGHPVGDDVLKQTAGLLKQMIRKSDILVRLGGEEFIIILPSTNLEDACIIAERIRKKIEQYKYPVAGYLTASLGVGKKQIEETFDSWYKRCDFALYKAKGKKRNCVVQATN